MSRFCEFSLGLGTQVYIQGGPYRHKPKGFFGVKMAKEIPLACDVDVPTQDFSVPNKKHLLRGLDKTLTAILEGESVYVGCMGGIGRTGLFLAALAKVLGYDDPIGHVRQHYRSHAVETKEQEQYIIDLDVRWLRLKFWLKVRCYKALNRGIWGK
jgi:hypothetical protein